MGFRLVIVQHFEQTKPTFFLEVRKYQIDFHIVVACGILVWETALNLPEYSCFKKEPSLTFVS